MLFSAGPKTKLLQYSDKEIFYCQWMNERRQCGINEIIRLFRLKSGNQFCRLLNLIMIYKRTSIDFICSYF